MRSASIDLAQAECKGSEIWELLNSGLRVNIETQDATETLRLIKFAERNAPTFCKAKDSTWVYLPTTTAVDHASRLLGCGLTLRSSGFGKGIAGNGMEVLTQQTIGAATHFGLSEVAGTLTPGRRADLVILSHDPRWSDEISISETWLDGIPVQV